MMNELKNYSTNPGFIEITNMGGFVASFSVNYALNGQDFDEKSGAISLFFSKKISIPSNAKNIHVLVVVDTGLGNLIPVYNNNWNSSGILKAKLSGTIVSPQIEILSDSKPAKFQLSIINRLWITCNYILEYTFNEKLYSINSGNFFLDVIRNISIPESAKNLTLSVIHVTALSSNKIFAKSFPEALNLKFSVYGTPNEPKVGQLSSIPNIGLDPDPNIPLIKISKTSNKNQIVLGEKVTFSINISNVSGSTAKMLILSENLPSEATFVENSFMLNGTKMIGNFLPTQGLLLKDININDSIKLSYDVIFNKIPSTNPVQDKPLLNYNYVDSKGKTKSTSIIGETLALTVLNNLSSGQNTSPSCCCCCCCKLCNSTYSHYNQYLSYMKSMGYI